MDGAIELVKGQEGNLGGPTATGTAQAKAIKEKLSAIIDILNNKFGLNLPDHIENMLEGVSSDLAGKPEIKMAAQANDKDNFKHVFRPALEEALVDHHADNGDFINKIFSDGKLLQTLCDLTMDRVYGQLRRPSLPFRRLPLAEVNPFVNCVPALDLKVAAGSFSAFQSVEDMPQAARDPGLYDWVQLPGRAKPAPGIFVAQVLGESMNRRIPNGAWCVWRANPAGSREGKVVLAQHRDIHDPDTGGQYTVKVYSSEKTSGENGGWEHGRIFLRPDSDDASFLPITLENVEEGAFRILAELVEVLGPAE